MSDWKKIEPEMVDMGDSTFWDFEKDEEFVGKLILVNENVGPNKSKIYRFKTQSGDEISIWGSAVLDTRLKMVAIGSLVKINYIGKEQSKSGRSYKNFDVYVKEPEKKSQLDEEFPDKKKEEDEDIDPSDIPF